MLCSSAMAQRRISAAVGIVIEHGDENVFIFSKVLCGRDAASLSNSCPVLLPVPLLLWWESVEKATCLDRPAPQMENPIQMQAGRQAHSHSPHRPGLVDVPFCHRRRAVYEDKDLLLYCEDVDGTRALQALPFMPALLVNEACCRVPA